MARRRPWRAVAYIPDATAPQGRKREVAGQTAACEQEGLDAFKDRHTEQGHVVDVVHLETLPGLEYDREA